MAKPYGVGDRIFDGLAILPRHILEKPYSEGKLGQFWSSQLRRMNGGTRTIFAEQYVPGERIVLERIHIMEGGCEGTRLPYLDEIVFLFVPSADDRCLRFQFGRNWT